jgi:hypothetical protein
LSAKASAGYVADGAPASVSDVTGIGTDGEAGGAVAESAVALVGGADPAAPGGEAAEARLLDDGGVAGVKPATATASGFDWAEGNCGLAERATAEESSGALSFFHHAKRGPDLQPVTATTTATTTSVRNKLRVIGFNSELDERLDARQWSTRPCDENCSGAAIVKVFGIAGLR